MNMKAPEPEILSSEEVSSLLDLTRDLVRIPSTATDGPDVYEFAEEWLKSSGLPVFRQAIKNPHIEYGEVFNIYVRLGNGSGPRIHLNCHLDTVGLGEGWNWDPWGAKVEGGRVYGLGAADMKGGCAAAMMAMAALSRRCPQVNGEVFLACVFGEEAPFSLGTDTLLKEHGLVGFDLAIVTEPSGVLAGDDMCLTHGRKHKSSFPVVILGAEGRILFEIDFYGRPAHASHPEYGVNAIHDAARFIDKVTAFDLFSHIRMGRGHYCVISLHGGEQCFTVPSHAQMLVNRQLTLGESPKLVMAEMKKIIASMGLKSRVAIRKRFTPAPELEYLPYLSAKEGLVKKFVDFAASRSGVSEITDARPGQAPVYDKSVQSSAEAKPVRKSRSLTHGKNRFCTYVTNSVGDFNLLGARAGVPTVVFGPGGGNIHSPNEFLSVDELIMSTDYITDFLLKLFK